VGLFVSHAVLGSADPLESAVRLVLGLWSIYLGVQDVLRWRSPVPTN
jgi:hypothetical protein